jgi:diguanylate cyclase (GGDEF)-like protein
MKELKKTRLNVLKDLALGYSIYTIFLVFSYFLNLLNMDLISFLTLLTFVWSGNLLYYIIIKTNLNLKFDEPDLFMPMMIWSIFCILAPTYFMTSTMRSIFVMNYFLVVIFGVFKLNLKQFIILTGFAISTLGFVILFSIRNVEQNYHEVYNELLLWAVFSLTSISFAFICNNISMLRKKLKDQKLEILNAFSDIHKLTITDELTGVYNRRYVMDFIATRKLKADKGLDKFITCIIDIDHFKKINDTYGHDVGDVVLKRFAQEINGLIRHDDCFARIGGEEFILVLSHIDMDIAKEVVNRIMNNVKNISFKDYPDLKLTISIGMTAYEKDMTTEQLFKRVDVLLYKAKNQGRDRYVHD